MSNVNCRRPVLTQPLNRNDSAQPAAEEKAPIAYSHKNEGSRAFKWMQQGSVFGGKFFSAAGGIVAQVVATPIAIAMTAYGSEAGHVLKDAHTIGCMVMEPIGHAAGTLFGIIAACIANLATTLLNLAFSCFSEATR